jgi:hypothetical protein
MKYLLKLLLEDCLAGTTIIRRILREIPSHTVFYIYRRSPVAFS